MCALLHGTLHKKCPYSNYPDQYFPTFGLNMERHSVCLRIQSEYGKMRTRITPNTDTFHVVEVSSSINAGWKIFNHATTLTNWSITCILSWVGLDSCPFWRLIEKKQSKKRNKNRIKQKKKTKSKQNKEQKKPKSKWNTDAIKKLCHQYHKNVHQYSILNALILQYSTNWRQSLLKVFCKDLLVFLRMR